uniref:Uncharacterized protein n=1 Tax=Meloidogyne enterolobii TaxID=390850 RepID=A0A6V7UL37_MELEN|nr:unnamed protein product [Meloidogyne enterolobii]
MPSHVQSSATCPHGKVFNRTMNLTHPQQIQIKYKLVAEHNIGRGGTAVVHHAYWPAAQRCIALKNAQLGSGTREVAILEHFNRLAENERNHIIKMFA